MPGVYSKDKFDLAGFSVGLVSKKKILNKEKVKANDIILLFHQMVFILMDIL